MPRPVDILVGVRDMANLMIQADLVIIGGGSTVWEACALGIPMIIKVLAQNQCSNANSLKKLGAAIVMDDSVDISGELAHALDSLQSPNVLKTLSLNASKITDGAGCQLVCNQLLSDSELVRGAVRKMTPRDLEMVLFWRNHESVKKHMFSRGEITLAEHIEWFSRVSQDPCQWILIYEENKVALGFIHFIGAPADRQGTVEWGFYLSPNAPKGVGRRMGKSALSYIFEVEKVASVRGIVASENIVSKKFHIKMGFRVLHPDDALFLKKTMKIDTVQYFLTSQQYTLSTGINEK